ncbi:hypothetical protein GCM10009626_09720 [Brachybacterium sacelli]
MTVSMRVMSAGDGYKYLLRSVAAADGDRTLSTPLTRYYAEAGTPWGGKGNSVIAGGDLAGLSLCESRLHGESRARSATETATATVIVLVQRIEAGGGRREDCSRAGWDRRDREGPSFGVPAAR